MDMPPPISDEETEEYFIPFDDFEDRWKEGGEALLHRSGTVAFVERFAPEQRAEVLFLLFETVHAKEMACAKRMNKAGLDSEESDRELRKAMALSLLNGAIGQVFLKQLRRGSRTITVDRGDVAKGCEAIVERVIAAAVAWSREDRHPETGSPVRTDDSPASTDGDQRDAALDANVPQVRQRTRPCRRRS